MNSSLSKYPIVDTDIWVSLVFSKFDERLIKNYGSLIFADVVAKEIMRWKSNDSKAREVALHFDELRQHKLISIIDFHNFSTFEQMAINHQLEEYGLQSVNITEKNKGEFVSLLYALNLDVKIFKTNDHAFSNELDDTTKQLITIMHWDEILNQFSKSFKEKIEIEKLVKQKQENMKKQRQAYQQDPRWDKLKSLMEG